MWRSVWSPKSAHTLSLNGALDSIAVTAAVVHDKPRFPFRATIIDTSRHYYSVEAILEHLDAMSAVKMNGAPLALIHVPAQTLP